MDTPVVGAKYRHFKGKDYVVLAIAKHTETNEDLVIYQALYGNHDIWARPLSMWFDHIKRDGYDGPRLTLIPDDE